jgi:hypothetical protein
MIPFRALTTLPFTTLSQIASALSRDIDSGQDADAKRALLERVFAAMKI